MSPKIRQGIAINSTYKFSLYSNLMSAKRHEAIIDVNELFEIMKLGRYKESINRLRTTKSKEEYNKQKRSAIPCVTLSGEFGARSSKGFIRHSGLIQVDIDHDSRLQDSKMKLKKDPYTYLSFLSPGGKGIKLVVKINPSIDTHREQFLALEKYYLEEYDIIIDPSCKDISRAMLLSYDPQIYCNPFSEVFEECFIEAVDTNVLKEPRVVYAKKVGYSSDEVELVERITRAVEAGNIDITSNYNDWVKLGYALDSCLGERGRSYFHRISSLYPGYSEIEADTKYTQLSSNNNGSVTMATFVFMAKKAGIEISSFDNRKADALINNREQVKISKKQQEAKDLELKDNLKQLRLRLAKDTGVKAFQVFYNGSLEEIVRVKPSTSEQLLKIKGIGKKKVDWFGKEMLELINANLK